MAGKDEDKTAAPSKGGKTKRDGGAATDARRPAHMIDLKAEEVESEPDAPTPASGPDEGRGASESEGDSAPSERGADQPDARTATPPQRTRPGEIRGFVTHLAAGLVGGVIGVAGLGYGLGKLPPAVLDGDAQRQAASQTSTALDDRIGALESEFAALKEKEKLRSGDQITPETVKALDTRLSDAEKSLAGENEIPAETRERLAALEKTLATLRDSAAQGGDIAQTAAITARIDAIASRLDARIQAIETSSPGEAAANEAIAELRKEFGALSEKLASQPVAQSPAIPEGLAERLEEIERSLSRIGVKEAEKADAAEGLALAAAFAALTRAAENGAPFASELEAVKKLIPEGLDLTRLAGHAQDGALTRLALRQQFGAYRQPVREAMPPPQDDASLIGQLLGNARSVVRVRRIDGDDGDDVSASLSRVAAHLEEGDIAGAVTEAMKLPEASRKPLLGWLERARARIALDTALAHMSEQMAGSLAGGKAVRTR